MINTIHFGWDGIVDGKKKDGTEVQPGGIKFHASGSEDSELLGYSKSLPVLEIMEDAKGTVQQGVRIFFDNQEDVNAFKADILEQLK